MADASIAAPVEYRNIDGCPGYRVGSDGSVWSCLVRSAMRQYVPGEPWRQLSSGNVNGYRNVCIRKNGNRWCVLVHTLVATAFHGPCPDGMECCHDNGIPSDNSKSNLRWDTPEKNNADKVKHCTQQRGAKTYNAKFTDDLAREIVSRHRDGETQLQLANEFNVSRSAIASLTTGAAWKHATGIVRDRENEPVNFLKRGSNCGASKLNDDIVRQIRKLGTAGMPQRRIAASFGVSKGTVANILSGKNWAHVDQGASL